MLVKVNDVFKIKNKGYCITIRIPPREVPKAGDYLGKNLILAVDKMFRCCFTCTCVGEHVIECGILIAEQLAIGEELELIKA